MRAYTEFSGGTYAGKEQAQAHSHQSSSASRHSASWYQLINMTFALGLSGLLGLRSLPSRPVSGRSTGGNDFQKTCEYLGFLALDGFPYDASVKFWVDCRLAPLLICVKVATVHLHI